MVSLSEGHFFSDRMAKIYRIHLLHTSVGPVWNFFFFFQSPKRIQSEGSEKKAGVATRLNDTLQYLYSTAGQTGIRYVSQ